MSILKWQRYTAIDMELLPHVYETHLLPNVSKDSREVNIPGDLGLKEQRAN